MITAETTSQRPRRRAVLALLAVAAATVLASFAAVQPAQAAFPGANGNIAFENDGGSGNRDIDTMSPDGTNQASVASGPLAEEDAAFSPDGTKIAFARNDGFGNGGFNIYVKTVTRFGRSEDILVDSPADDVDPTWSPDGSFIAFASNFDFGSNTFGNTDIFFRNAKPTVNDTPSHITDDAALDAQPAWSPDGKKIAYMSNLGGNFDIYTINGPLASPDLAHLTSDPATDSKPSWSPDGKKIAFASTRDGNANIYKMNADGSSQKRLTKNAAADFAPAFSPDGKKIAFQSNRDGNDEIYRMNARDGSKQKNVSGNGGANDTNPDWGVATQLH